MKKVWKLFFTNNLANCQIWGHVSFVLDKAQGRYRYSSSSSASEAGSMFMAHMLALIQLPPLTGKPGTEFEHFPCSNCQCHCIFLKQDL